jgi:hypothetical protein
MAEIQERADNLVNENRDAESAKSVARRMDRMREENRHLFGVQDIGVGIIRRMRGCRSST